MSEPIPLGNQTARAHVRTKRNDSPAETLQTPIISKRWLETLAPKSLGAQSTRRLSFTMPA